MIADLLPRYDEAHGKDGTFEILRSIMIDGHEVAWMKYSGTILFDMLELGREGQAFDDYRLYCECDFTEGVGWKIDEKHGVVGLSHEGRCIRFQAAIDLRVRELRNEYYALFDVHYGMGAYGLTQHIDEIVADLIERDKRGEFVAESGSGAHFYGGHFYIETLARILGTHQPVILKDIRRLMKEHKIALEGFVVQEYRTPPEPRWDESFSYEQDGYVVKGYLPAHSKMRQDFKLDLYDVDGKLINTDYLSLNHPVLFGPDGEDVMLAQDKCVEMVNSALQNS
jgi:hypothetical protein